MKNKFKKNIILASLFFVTIITQAQPQKFEIKNGNFLINGKTVMIRAGELHYARVPKEYWKQRLLMLKAMGLNTVSTYVFWNYHHPKPNVWNFTTDNHNLKQFLSIAKEVGLFVILRPGPYVCAEWEFGGFPWWLPTVKGLEIRTNNQPFLDSCKTYFQQLAKQIKGMHISEGGPIILTQVENEFGSYVWQRRDIPLKQHKQYTAAIKKILEETGFKPPYYTADGRTLFNGGYVDGVFPSANGEDNIDSLKATVNKYNNGVGPYFVAEFYPGWLDHWAEPFPKVATEKVVEQTEIYLKNNISFSYYMIHGGTNFAYTAGANYSKEHPIQPDLTSYDYDAPISEAGWATPKYIALRNLIQQYTSYKLPDIPKAAPVVIIPSININKTINFFEWKKTIKPITANHPLSFEELHQGFGFVLYSIKIENKTEGEMNIDGLRDYATIYVNGKRVAELNRYYNNTKTHINIPANAQLDILVENMGRINYGAKITESFKGIISSVIINGKEITGNWNMYLMPLEQQPDFSNISQTKITNETPAFYSTNFNIEKIGDMFLNMENWGKGIVFVNGHNLGRFWNVGPQQTLYLPGCWLNKGKNSIVIFDQKNDTIQKEISFSKEPVLEKLKH